MIQSNGKGPTIVNNLEQFGICDVWNHNIDEEFEKMILVIEKYPYVAMDTEFPGVVARPIGEFRSTADYQYQLLRCNVDLLKIIQLGLTFYDEKGNMPEGTTTWQFNFKFNLMEDMYAQDSIELLQNSGIQFKRHEDEGIDTFYFAATIMMSGLILMNNVKWLSFHSGYDFGYMLKLLTNTELPTVEHEFFDLLKTYFPCIYDIKYLMKSCKNLKGGLQEVADQLELERVGPQHQAGSDSLLTGASFFKMREMFFEDNIDDAKYCGHLYGLGASYMSNGTTFPDDTIITSTASVNTTILSTTSVTTAVTNTTTTTTANINSADNSSSEDDKTEASDTEKVGPTSSTNDTDDTTREDNQNADEEVTRLANGGTTTAISTTTPTTATSTTTTSSSSSSSSSNSSGGGGTSSSNSSSSIGSNGSSVCSSNTSDLSSSENSQDSLTNGISSLSVSNTTAPSTTS